MPLFETLRYLFLCCLCQITITGVTLKTYTSCVRQADKKDRQIDGQTDSCKNSCDFCRPGCQGLVATHTQSHLMQVALWNTPTPWLTRICFSQISLTRLFKWFTFLAKHALWNKYSFTNTYFTLFLMNWFYLLNTKFC